VVWGLLNGATPSGLAAVGMGLGGVALVLTSYTPSGQGSVVQGAVLGVASGVAFGTAFTLMGQISEAAGVSTVLVQRVVGMAMLTAVALMRPDPFLAPRGPALRYGVAAGVPAVVAIASLQLAYQKGDLGEVSVASSQFATVAVLLSVMFNRERMRWWQAIGVGVTAVSVALIATG